jgi:hypothetical protein
MRHAVRCNVPPDPLKWSVDRAAIEFKLAPHTLRKNLVKDGAEPDAAFCYTTEQICQAIFGSMHVEKLGTQREIRRKLELENSIVEASVLNRSALSSAFAALADAVVSRIRVSKLDRSEQDDLLRELSSIPIILDNVARSQTRLRRNSEKNGNGEAAEDAVAIKNVRKSKPKRRAKVQSTEEVCKSFKK